MRKQTKARLVDRLVEAYVGWREACLIVDDTYRSWSRNARAGAATAFQSYCTALDAEERAAEVYARMVRRAGGLIAADTQIFPGIAA
ncbi:MAG TPA: hypothetical protein VGH93_00595 [Solirubrobacteraceae bacterium]